jgi:OOP family OmpA-OmpF porin
MKRFCLILLWIIALFALPFWFWGQSWNDSDGDGVPNHLDRCPGTTEGMTVDSFGCPADSDGDSVIDLRDECPETPKDVQVNSNGCPLDNDSDGVYDGQDKCPGTPSGTRVDENGCPVDDDQDGVENERDQCPGTPLGARVDERGCWVMKGIQFPPGEWVLPEEAYPVLDEVVRVLEANFSLRVEIQGYTDNSGPEDANQKISEVRAKAVMDYLAEKGIQAGRLLAVGYGPSKPIASNDTPEGRAKNRRVEIKPMDR